MASYPGDGLVNRLTLSGGGDVTGPSSSTNNDVAVFNGTTGKIIADSGVNISTLSGGPFLPLAGGTMAGAINMNSHNITNGSQVSGAFDGFDYTLGGTYFAVQGIDSSGNGGALGSDNAGVSGQSGGSGSGGVFSNGDESLAVLIGSDYENAGLKGFDFNNNFEAVLLDRNFNAAGNFSNGGDAYGLIGVGSSPITTYGAGAYFSGNGGGAQVSIGNSSTLYGSFYGTNGDTWTTLNAYNLNTGQDFAIQGMDGIGNTVFIADGTNAITAYGPIVYQNPINGSGPPGSILTSYQLYVDSLTGIVYCN